MDFKALVTAARTCRRFVEDSPLHMSDLEWLADCARLTPSARNAQVLRYVLITGRMVAEILPLTVWAGALKDWGGPHPGERPTGFLALLVPDEARELTFIDAGIAAQTVQLAATSRGWGCCIIASFQKNRLEELLHIPAGYKIELMLGLGVAKEERRIVPLPEDGSVSYWRDAEGVHYVPKRDLDDCIVGRYRDEEGT